MEEESFRKINTYLSEGWVSFLKKFNNSKEKCWQLGCKIYVTNKKNHRDFLKILRTLEFTTLPDDVFMFITEGHVKMRTKKQIELLQEQIRDKIKDSKPEDYIFLKGGGKLDGLISGEWLSKHKYIRFLRFDSKEKIKMGIYPYWGNR